jgi:hypothetical protein
MKRVTTVAGVTHVISDITNSGNRRRIQPERLDLRQDLKNPGFISASL